MRYIIALLLILGLVSSSVLASESWILVGKSDRSHFYMYRGSLDTGSTTDGQRIFYVAGKYEVIATKESVVQVWYVPVQDCIKSSGKLYITDAQGQAVTNIDFKPGDDSIGASLAKLICNTALNLISDPKNRT